MKKTIRNKIVAALTTLSAVCLLGSVGTTMRAFAEEETTTVAAVAFTMKQGASVRLSDVSNEDENGLRYGITMPKSDYTKLMNNVGGGKAYSAVSFGILLAPASYEATATLRAESFLNNYFWEEKNAQGEWVLPTGMTTVGKTQIMNFESQVMVKDEENADNVRYYGSMVGVLDNNLGKDFVGVGYIKYTENSTTKYRFAADNDNTRTVAYIASKAVNDGKVNASFNNIVTKYIKGGIDGETLAFTEETTNVGVGAKKQLALNTTTDLQVVYTSNDTEVATVSATGEVTGVSAGETTITAKIGTLFSATTTVTVEDNRTRDDLLAEQYTTENIAAYPYTYAKGSVSVQRVSDNAVTMPTGFESETYLQYNVDNDTEGKNLYGYAISMNNGITGVADMPASASLQNEFNVTDWSNAYVGFWVYQQSDMDFRVYHFGKALDNAEEQYNFGKDALSQSIAKNTWTYVEWKLTDFNTSYTSNPFAMDSYFLRVGFGYKSSANVAIGELDQTFYIAGFDIYNKQAVTSVAIDNTDLATYVVKTGTEQYQYARTTTSAALVNEASASSNSYVQYTMTSTVTAQTGKNHFGCPILINTATDHDTTVTNPLDSGYAHLVANMDWTKDVYMGMWVKNTSAQPLMLVASTSDAQVAVYTEKFARTFTDNEWHYFEVPLKDIGITTNPFAEGSYNVNVMAAYVETGATEFTGTYCIDGVSFYTNRTEKSAADMLVEHALYNTNVKIESSLNAFGAATATVENFDNEDNTAPVNGLNNYIKYSVDKGSWANSGNLGGHMIDFSGLGTGVSTRRVANSVSSDLISAMNLPTATIKSVSFWVRNDTGYEMQFCAYDTKIANIGESAFDLNTVRGSAATKVASGSGWRQLTFDISALDLTAEKFDSTDNRLALSYYIAGNQANVTGAKFYIAGLTFNA